MANTKADQANDLLLQKRLLQNAHIVEHEALGRVLLHRPTPNEDFLIAEARQERYTADLFDDRYKSKVEIEKKAVERGLWSPETSDKIEELTRKTGEAMGILDALQFQSIEQVHEKYRETAEQLATAFVDVPEVTDALRRYVALDGSADYADRTALVEAAPGSEVDDLLDALDALRTQYDVLTSFLTVRRELKALQDRQTRLFIDSIESRADRAEELARVYYCAKDAETHEPLWPTLDEMKRQPADVIEFLVTEMSYFLYNITDEFRRTLGKYGFLKRQTEPDVSSADSPALPLSNSDGESPASEPTPSSEATA